MTFLKGTVLTLLLAVLSRNLSAQDAAAPTTNIPVVGIAGITFRVSDLDKARRYYQGVLGFPDTFTLKDDQDRIASIFFKVNDEQYVEVVPGLAPGAINRQARVIFQSSD